MKDALVHCIHSDTIRARQLEMNDDEATLSGCLARATAVQILTYLNKAFQNEVYSVRISFKHY